MNNLRLIRKKRGFTCETLGEKVNVGKSAVSKYERGEIQPSQDVLKKMAEVLGCSIDYLLGVTDNPLPATVIMPSETKQPLSDEKAAEVLQLALVKGKLTSNDGLLSEKGAQVLSDFILANANILKKLIDDNA